jgi:glycosyltransferase involved in cell wall biosynthesis
MRVAFVTHYTDLYGANRSLLSLVDGLARRNVSCYAVSPAEGAVTDALRDRSVPVLVTPVAHWMTRRTAADGFSARVQEYASWRRRALRRLRANLRGIPALVRQLRQWNVDLVYTNSSVVPLGAVAAKLVGLPHVWHLREMGDLDYGLAHDWGECVFRLAVGSADAVIANSEAVRSHLLSGRTRERAHVIRNGVAWGAEFDRLRAVAQAQPAGSGTYTFALVGVIDPAKGQETAVKALAMVADCFPDVRLLLAGGGDTEDLRALADALGVVDRVDFLGYVEDPFTVYLAADAVLMCSRSEAMGRVTAEAMAACRPVVGRNSGGTPELIEHEHTGLLYDGAPESLAHCMIRFVEAPDWARQLGENGWRVGRDKYTIEAYSDAVFQILRSVTDPTRERTGGNPVRRVHSAPGEGRRVWDCSETGRSGCPGEPPASGGRGGQLPLATAEHSHPLRSIGRH